MTRAKTPDTTDEDRTAPQGQPDAPSQPAPATPAPAGPDTAPATGSVQDADLYEPYPGPQFFHGGRNSPIVAAMARRLDQEGCNENGTPLGADWTNGHKRAFAAWQHQLRPKEGGDVSGHPDETAWKKLQVPRVTPLPKADRR